jgi:hypothetical protein
MIDDFDISPPAPEDAMVRDLPARERVLAVVDTPRVQ